VPSAIQYRPFFLPPPTLMTISVSRSSMVGSYSKPWTSLATEADVDARIAVCLRPILRIVADVGGRLSLVGQSKCCEEVARLATI
jgi:hypothetical protein